MREHNHAIYHNQDHNHDTDLDWNKDEYDAAIVATREQIHEDKEIVDIAESFVNRAYALVKPAHGLRLDERESDSSFLSDEDNLERDLSGYEFLDYIRPHKRRDSGPDAHFSVVQADVLDDILEDMRELFKVAKKTKMASVVSNNFAWKEVVSVVSRFMRDYSMQIRASMSKNQRKEINNMYTCFELAYLEDYKITSKKLKIGDKKIRSFVAKKLKLLKEDIADLEPANNLDNAQ